MTVVVDSHVHIFHRHLPLSPNRRYAPNYDAELEDFKRLGRPAGVTHGVLVQPSFLGYDCSFMVDALLCNRDNLRGIVVVPPSVTLEDLLALRDAGVVGVRLNLDGVPLPDLTDEEWRRWLAHLRDLDMQVELHRDARDLHVLIPPLVRAGLRVVIDHFGRPDARLGTDDPGFQFLLSQAQSGRVWVKLSAGYRNGWVESSHPQALKAAGLLLRNFGAERLLWGSDWPHTRHEAGNDIASTMAALGVWVPRAGDRQVILNDTPRQLFEFDS